MVSVYVGNLSYETSWQTLKDHMKEAGEVVRQREDAAGRPLGRLGCRVRRRRARRTRSDPDGHRARRRKIVVRENGGKQREGGGEEGGGGPVRSRNGGSGTTVFVGNLSYDDVAVAQGS